MLKTNLDTLLFCSNVRHIVRYYEFLNTDPGRIRPDGDDTYIQTTWLWHKVDILHSSFVVCF
jgi:hypothetical protein